MKTLTTKIASVSLLAALSAGAAQAETLRLNHNLPKASVAGQVFETFADRVKELTDGELKIRVFHSGQLGGQRESIELVQQGALDIAKTNAAEMEAFESLYSVLNLPYLFESPEHVLKALEGEVGQELLAAGADTGFIGLGLMYDGCRSFYTNKPAASLDDLQGMKVRVQPSPSAIRMIELMGAQPTPIAFPELYSALQQGVVDGAENNPGALTYVRHGEVAKYFMVNQHACIPAVYVISAKSWEKLSPAKQQALRTASAEALQNSYDLMLADEVKQLEIFTSKMGGTVTEVDKAPFRAAVAPMIDEALAQGGQAAELIRKIQALAN